MTALLLLSKCKINCYRILVIRYCSTKIPHILLLLATICAEKCMIMYHGNAVWGCYNLKPTKTFRQIRVNYLSKPMAVTPHAAMGCYHTLRASWVAAIILTRRKHDYALSHLVIPPDMEGDMPERKLAAHLHF